MTEKSAHRLLGIAMIMLGLTLAAENGHTQTWPSKPVRVIVSQAAGGTPDLIARLVTERMSRNLGQQFVVENRTGGSNVIGAQLAARAPADGYNFFFATAAALVTNPYTFKALPYDPERDFTAVAMVGKAPFMVLVNSAVPAKTLRDLIALDRSDPGKLSVANDGPRNFSGLVAAWLNKLGNMHMQLIPYATMPQGVQDTLAGRTQVVILAVPSARPLIQRGELRPLAVTSTFRVPGYEDVPPVAETFPGFDLVGWFAFVAPAGTPNDIVQQFNREVARALNDADVATRLRDVGIFPQGISTPQELAEFIRADRRTWGKVVREIGIEPE